MESIRMALTALIATGTLVVAGCTGTLPDAPPSNPEDLPEISEVLPFNPLRAASYNEVAKGIGLFEQAHDRQLFTGAMEFFELPKDQDGRQEAMSWHPDALRQLQEANLAPTIILEPHQDVSFSPSKKDPENKRLKKLAESYFRELREAGITTEQLGRMVVTPEVIEGGWKGGDPVYFAQSVNRQLEALQGDDQFPDAKGGILIDTHPDEWKPVLAALRENPKEALDWDRVSSVGIQAYTNTAEVLFADDGTADISGFLTVNQVLELAELAGDKPVWLNVGITKTDEFHNNQYSPAQRQAIADAIVGVAAQAQQKGVTITDVMLFGVGKTTEEGRDYSFAATETAIPLSMSDKLRQLNIGLGGFFTAPVEEDS